MSDEVTGRLENWVLGLTHKGECIIWGFVYGDSKDRWPDGNWIHTSGTPIKDFKEGEYIQTRNSKYLLGKPMAEAMGGPHGVQRNPS